MVKQKQESIKPKTNQIKSEVKETTLRGLRYVQEKVALSWLNLIPMEEYGFVLKKSECRDAVSIRFNKTLRGLPKKCPGGQEFYLTHALNCKHLGFVILRHNNIRDFEANMLKKVVCANEIDQKQTLNRRDAEKYRSHSQEGYLKFLKQPFYFQRTSLSVEEISSEYIIKYYQILTKCAHSCINALKLGRSSA